MLKKRYPMVKTGPSQAQTALEYILLLGAVTVIVLLAFKTLLPKAYHQSEGYFNVAACGIYGEAVFYNRAGNIIDKARMHEVYP